MATRPRGRTFLPTAVSLAVAAVASVATAALAGWWLGAPLLHRALAGTPPLVPTEAAGLALAGIALGLARRAPVPPARAWAAAAAAAAFVALVGSVALAEHCRGTDQGIDRLLAPHADAGLRPALPTALALALLGPALGLLALPGRRAGQASQVLAVLAVLVALLALLGHAVGLGAFYGRFPFWPSEGMALPAALLVVLLGAGALCARPDRGLAGLLLSPGAGGVVARLLLLTPVAVPLALGLLRVAAERAGVYHPALGSWLFALSNIAASTLVIWAIAAALHRADARRAEAEEALRGANRELQRANEELEAFNASVSHDLRSPLTGAGGFAELLLARYGAGLPAEAREYARQIQEGTRRMARLVDDLLTFSRLGRQPLRRQAVSVAGLVRGCLAELGGGEAGRRLDVRVGDLADCEGDAALLRQVWLNLLSNALKYTRGRDPAVIEVGCQAGGGAPAYFVRDNGAGFDMARAGRLFEAFQRLHPAEEFGGTGVGLTIVRRVVERHGGRAWAEAEPGRGATFFFTLGPDAAPRPGAAPA